MLAWMDLEMTGLDPKRHVIVEIATLITDDDLNLIAEGPDIVVRATDEDLAEMDEVVRTMHGRSGLLAAIRSSEVDLADAGQATLDFLRSHIPQPGTVPLCGNSIGTDRRFLARWLPEIDQFLHYRSIDVSTIKELARRWYPEVHAAQPRKVGSHRAMGDVLESVAELAYYRESIFRPPSRSDGADPDPAAAVTVAAAVPPPEAAPEGAGEGTGDDSAETTEAAAQDRRQTDVSES